jgi:hypothetical protein
MTASGWDSRLIDTRPFYLGPSATCAPRCAGVDRHGLRSAAKPRVGTLTVIAADRRHMVSVNDEPRTACGTPTGERLLGIPRRPAAAATILRLMPRLA